MKHAYVSNASDWRWSLFREWVKRGVYDVDWGQIEPEWIKDLDLEQVGIPMPTLASWLDSPRGGKGLPPYVIALRLRQVGIPMPTLASWLDSPRGGKGLPPYVVAARFRQALLSGQTMVIDCRPASRTGG